MLKLLIENWNNWYLLVMILPIEVIIWRIVHLRIRMDTYELRYSRRTYRMPTTVEHWKEDGLHKKTVSVKALRASLLVQSITLAVLLFIESFRGVLQLMMDAGQAVSPWISSGLFCLIIFVVGAPFIYNDVVEFRYRKRKGIGFEEELSWRDHKYLPYVEPNPVVIIMGVILAVILLGFMICDRPAPISASVLILAVAACYYAAGIMLYCITGAVTVWFINRIRERLHGRAERAYQREISDYEDYAEDIIRVAVELIKESRVQTLDENQVEMIQPEDWLDYCVQHGMDPLAHMHRSDIAQ